LAIYLGRNAGTLSADRSRGLIKALKALPQKAQQVLELDESVSKVAELFKESDTFFLVGRHLNYPIALEGALKIKEISYVFSDGFAAGELKHGPLALITTNVPVIAIATDCPTYDKVVSNIREIKARDASVIAIANESNTGIDQLADIVIRIPDASEYISPIMSVILLQIFSYYTALYRGCPIDKPRNLAKSVTVE
ncbi:MAG TPA: SIS domain-containing protein, partial [Methanocellaceae archaeon]